MAIQILVMLYLSACNDKLPSLNIILTGLDGAVAKSSGIGLVVTEFVSRYRLQF